MECWLVLRKVFLWEMRLVDLKINADKAEMAKVERDLKLARGI